MLQFHRAFGPAAAAMERPSRIAAVPAEKRILVTLVRYTARRCKFFNRLCAVRSAPVLAFARGAHVMKRVAREAHLSLMSKLTAIPRGRNGIEDRVALKFKAV